MNRISVKLLGAIAIFFFIAIMPIAVFATNENISVVNSSENEYIIYIKNYTDKNFKYAFTNNAEPQEMDLTYINSSPDLGENQVAFLNAETYEKLKSKTIYMWAKDKEENLILRGIQLDLENAMNKEDIGNVETITKRITVNIADSEDKTTEIRKENIDGVEESASVGYIQITDDSKAKYYYQTIKLPNTDEYNKMMELTEKIQKEYEKMNMYDKIQLVAEFNSLYSKLAEVDNWKEVQNMKVEQPEDSIKGDKYIVFLKKVANDGKVTIDAQFLTAYDDYKPNVIKQQKVTQETAKLPITYDSIALIVILAIVVIALVIVFIRMKKLNKRNEAK